MRYSLLITILLICSLTTSFAQKEANNWCFGFHAGINFNTTPPSLFTSSINTSEGCASISNGNGQLLFYTDGIRAWNRNHQQMQNGFGMMGHPSSTQSAVILPQPGNDSIYYIFTSDGIECGLLAINHDCGYNGINYSVVNMKRNNGLGDIVIKNKPLAPFRMHEKITAVKHANNNDYWVITHKWNTNEFYEFLVTPGGVDSVARIIPIGSTLPQHESRLGCLKASSNGKKLAVAYWKDFYELFNFNNQTGAITNPIRIAPERLPEQMGPYGVEFSCNADYLYLSEGISWFGFFSGVNPIKYKIYQYNITVHDSVAIRNTKYVVDSLVSTDTTVWGMQMGPDNKIYVTFDKRYLGAITNPGAAGAGCNYVRQYITFPSTMQPRLGLPNFNQSFLNPVPFFTVQNNCISQQLSFLSGGINQVDSVRWNFGDPGSAGSNTSSIQNPVHLFSSNGFYEVTLIVYKRCQTDTIRKMISVGDHHALLGSDTVLCTDSKLVLRPHVASAIYEWNDGSAADSMVISLPGIYWVKIKLGDCVSTDSIYVDYKNYPSISIGADINVCTDQFPINIGQQTNSVTYLWNTGAVTPFIAISFPGLYWLEVNNGFCKTRDSIQAIEKPLPRISFGNDTIMCEGEILTLAIGDSSLSCTWSTGSSAYSIPVTAPGLYWCSVVSEYGCTARDSIIVSYQAKPVVNLGRDTVLCEGQTLLLDVSATGDEFLWNDQSHLPVYIIDKPGKYFVRVKKGMCHSSDTINVQYIFKPHPNLGRDTILCAGNYILLDPKAMGNSYIWQDGSTGNRFAVQRGGLYSVTVTGVCGSGSDQVIITEEICDIYIPDAFTPNNDGLNDQFGPLNAYDIDTITFSIFNRSGQRIFYTQDKTKQWDGKFKHIDQPTGIYIWVLKYNKPGMPEVSLKGKVALIR